MKMSLLPAGGLDSMSFEGIFQPKLLCDALPPAETGTTHRIGDGGSIPFRMLKTHICSCLIVPFSGTLPTRWHLCIFDTNWVGFPIFYGYF